MAGPYRVDISVRALKQIRAFAAPLQQRLIDHIMALRDDPRPPGSRKMAGDDDLYRIRVGSYRVIYAIDDDVLTVLVVKVGHRPEVYR